MSAAAQTNADATGMDAAGAVEFEVMNNITRQPVGDHTLASFNLPEDFVRRLAHQVIRSTYWEARHVIVDDPPAAAPGATTTPGEDSLRAVWMLAIAGAVLLAALIVYWRGARPVGGRGVASRVLVLATVWIAAAAPAGKAPDGRDKFRVVHPPLPPASNEVAASRAMLREERPPIRGFRAPILADAGRPWPFDQPGEDDPPQLRDASSLIARTLATDGLLTTAAAAMQILAPLNPDQDPEDDVDLLHDAGLPVDWLRHFQAPGAPPGDPRGVTRQLRRWITAGRSLEDIRTLSRSIPFEFRPSREGFSAATECGEHEFGTVRLQMTRGTYWAAPGGGDSLDLSIQLLQRLPDADFLLTVQQRDLADLKALMHGYQIDPARVTLVADRGVVSQWAADNGKAGAIRPASSAEHPRPALLVPRFASRRQDGSIFIPNESFLVEGLAAAGLEIIQSPLLFQGGNIIPIRNPVSGQRVLMLGEAELHRNTALGLAPEQALQAFCLEFDAERCFVIPPISFHIDYDMTIRTRGSELVAFVNDPRSAAMMILSLGLEAMERHGLIEPRAARAARHMLSTGDHVGFLNTVAAALQRHLTAAGQFPLSLTHAFMTEPSDSGVANLRLFRLAMDYLAAESIPAAQLTGDGHFMAYMATFRQQAADRAAMERMLDALGFRVVPVPGISDGDRSICPINGIHDRTRYLMPAWGGLYAPLDTAAQEIFQRELGPEVRVIPIFCGESQRRHGAIHCSVSVFPKTP